MCPLCHSNRVRRSRRQPFDYLLLILWAKPMRCRTCSYRYYKFPWSRPEESVLPELTGQESPAYTPPAAQRLKRSAAVASSGKR